MYDLNKEDIRIGTVIHHEKLERFAKHGFECYTIRFVIDDIPNMKTIADKVNGMLTDTGAIVSALECFVNPLEQGENGDMARKLWETLVDNAALFNCDLVTGFTGKMPGTSIKDNIERYVSVFSNIAKKAEEKGVKLAFENCPKPHAANIACNPAAWEMMFDALPADNIGLQWEPAHQMRQLIDPIAQLREWAPKVFHVHGKDGTLLWDVIKKHGICSEHAFMIDRTPGFGESNWTEIVSILRANNYKGTIDIEGFHDPVYKGRLEMTGQVHALNYLKTCRGGNYIDG